MEITITKDEFEKALPVGTSANEGVLEAVMPAISPDWTSIFFFNCRRRAGAPLSC